MRKTIAAGVPAFCGLVTTGVDISNADEVQVEGNYSTRAACMVDGPHVEVDRPGTWSHFSSVQQPDGLWYLYLSN